MKRGIIIFISLFNWLIAYCQSDQQIKNLETFTKLYGYIKYFHPSDEAVGTDWDRFAIYGSKLVSEAKNADELINILNKLFKPIAPSILITKKENKIEFDLKTITPKDSINYKVIAWQHLGNGIDGTMKNTYRSIRLNRNNKEKSNKSEFGNLMTHISAIKYQGKKIKLTGDVKIKNGSSGKGHLWVRVDRKNRKTGFFDNMSNNPIIDNTWNEYEITGKIDDDADKIYFGCFFNGNGELYVDNLKLFYKEDKQWIEIPIDNNDFEKDKIGDKISFWQKSGDSYLIRIADKQDKNNKCVAIGKLSTDYLFSKYPKIGKVIDKDIGNGIRTIIPLALYGDILETYPPANKDELKQLKRNLSEIEKDNVNDLFVKLGDIVITWNIFQHFYPYFNETKTDWNKELLKALNRCFSCKTLVDFILNMEEFTAALKDGHISIRSKEISLDYSAPISWDWVEDKLVITKVLDTTLKVKVGDIVKRIDNIDPKIYFDSIERYISAANLSSLKWKSHLRSLTGEKNSKIKIELENGLVHELVKDTKSSELNKIKTQTGNKPNYRFYPDNITYLHIGLISMETIDSLLPKLTTSKAIICDLRGYPKNNHDFISYILEKDDTANHIFRIPQIIYPDQQNIVDYKCSGWNLTAKNPHLNAKIIFIIDGRAISYAESFLGFIEGYKLATIAGQPSAGTNGNINMIKLPGNIEFQYTGLKVFKIDGSQHHGIGIIPNIIVERTIKGIKDRKDEFLEKALEIANSK